MASKLGKFAHTTCSTKHRRVAHALAAPQPLLLRGALTHYVYDTLPSSLDSEKPAPSALSVSLLLALSFAGHGRSRVEQLHHRYSLFSTVTDHPSTATKPTFGPVMAFRNPSR
jgi:hypothetical protein